MPAQSLAFCKDTKREAARLATDTRLDPAMRDRRDALLEATRRFPEFLPTSIPAFLKHITRARSRCGFPPSVAAHSLQ